MTDRKIIWTRVDSPNPWTKQYVGWVGPVAMFTVFEESHGSYPYFNNWRMGRYTDTASAMLAVQWYLDNPEKLPDF